MCVKSGAHLPRNESKISLIFHRTNLSKCIYKELLLTCLADKLKLLRLCVFLEIGCSFSHWDFSSAMIFCLCRWNRRIYFIGFMHGCTQNRLCVLCFFSFFLFFSFYFLVFFFRRVSDVTIIQLHFGRTAPHNTMAVYFLIKRVTNLTCQSTRHLRCGTLICIK